jgi:hypothetical protein
VPRQHDRELAVVLFRDRVASEDLTYVDGPAGQMADLKLYNLILSLRPIWAWI